MDFTAFALSQLPPPPAKVLEVGCGREGGITQALARAGYDALGADPNAPPTGPFVRARLEELDEAPYDAILAERAFHHVHPLDEALDKVARMTPLLVLDEFAWDRIDEPTREWYEGQHRMLSAAGGRPKGPPDLAEWRAAWSDLHPSGVLLAALRARFDERSFEERPYLYRWLEGPSSEALERSLLDAGAIRPIGFRWVGVRRGR